MAIVFEKFLSPKSLIVLWKIEEQASFFSEYLGNAENVISELGNISHPQKQLEWLASRTCVKHLCTKLGLEYQGIKKDLHNNPYLINSEGFVSLSHTHGYATAIVSLSDEVGIDIEKVSDKLSYVSHKFLSEPEYIQADNDLKTLCIYWCAKESLYKLHGRRNLSFKNNIFIDHFDRNPSVISGKITQNDQITSHTLHVFYENDFVLTVV
ncbi:4'-phosphopantetheinyl transferase superfamily protein [Pseudarcicella hirudinis]|uniref:4'-phosphopantetheinyl transferase superfamily protein n=1 Tax=Pseudarcicella hirudinis TaxID=1079859 RepID=A0A1I5WCF9_9BACT|nr:4'-phosphopantetheinyl transferase superfamily protein [Pseudarcicella hirudinis]SFQ17368.1 4'-phosphopantetheinyl transferase superfamily protein [Pseudarcicella hirudinis]